MVSPKDRLNESLNNTREIKKAANKQLSKLGVPKYVKDLQMASFDKRLGELMEQKDSIGKNIRGGNPNGNCLLRMLV